MTDLSEFLLARIAEDEALCREEIADGYGGWQHESGWSSGRVLAECEVKRRIVESQSGSFTWREEFSALSPYVRRGWHGSAEASFDGERWESMDDPEFIERYMEPSPPSQVLRLLALPYADHLAYREEWRP